MTYTIIEQLSDLQDDADFDAWADARCAKYEAEEDARHCLGGANDARSCTRGVMVGRVHDEWTAEDEARYQEEARRIEEERFDAWYENEGCYREAEDRALAAAYSEMNGYRF